MIQQCGMALLYPFRSILHLIISPVYCFENRVGAGGPTAPDSLATTQGAATISIRSDVEHGKALVLSGGRDLLDARDQGHDLLIFMRLGAPHRCLRDYLDTAPTAPH